MADAALGAPSGGGHHQVGHPGHALLLLHALAPRPLSLGPGVHLSILMYNILEEFNESTSAKEKDRTSVNFQDKNRKLDRGSIRSSLRYGLSTPYRLTIWTVLDCSTLFFSTCETCIWSFLH